MDPEFEIGGKPIALPADFAERVLTEARRRQARTRWTRSVATGLSLLAAVALTTRLPARMARLHRTRPAHQAQTTSAALVAGADLDGIDAAWDHAADIDPGSYFLAEADPEAQPEALGDEPAEEFKTSSLDEE